MSSQKRRSQSVLRYKVGERMSAHLWSELQLPGDYYVYRQMWSFFRADVIFTFLGRANDCMETASDEL